MCVAVPCRLLKAEGPTGVAQIGGAEVQVRLDLLPEAQPGDYVLVHAGFALELVDEEAAQETLELLRQMQES